MYSLSIDYLFNRIYDVLLWVKYTWLFSILRKDKETYLDQVAYRDWDGLRDRGWLSAYTDEAGGVSVEPEVHVSLWQKLLEKAGLQVRDTDSDGIPDVTDSRPYDSDNLTKSELKERYENDYSFLDHARDMFGIGPRDTDKDGVPNSYEDAHGLDKNNPDSDRDGALDGQELLQGTNPLNPDTDGDLVLDGRDEAPLDPLISSHGEDSDGDGVSDFFENIMGTDILKKDSDGDSILDNMDTYPLDPENIGRITPLDLKSATSHLSFSVQNPLLSLIVDFISIIAVLILIFFVYSFCRWFITFVEGLNHFDHHFHHNDHHTQGHRHHIIQDNTHTQETNTSPFGIVGLPTEEVSIVPATKVTEEFISHPTFSIIEGYLTSKSEALWRIGILEADNLLFEVLREKGYQGEGVGEMLKNASFRTVDLAWDAHKVRNRIAHEGSTFQLTEREAKRAFSLYESVFRDLKIIK